MNKLNKIILAFYTMFLFMPIVAYGQGSLENPIKYGSMGEFLVALLDVVVQIAFPIIVLAIIYTGFLFVSARGNEAKLEEAKRTFMWTVVGSLVVLGAAVLSNAIQGTVNQLRGSAPIENTVVLNESEFNL